jgi:phosphate-selective porin OprO and OprP
MMRVHRMGSAAVVILMLAAFPAAAEEPAKDEVKVDMSKGGVTFSSGDNSLTITGFAQLRYTADDKEDFDGDTSGSGVGKEDGLSQSFDATRIRLGVKGGMYKPWLKYEFEFEFSRTSGDSDSKLKDAFLEIHPRDAAFLKIGQYKVPFSLQQLTSDRRQEFVERALTDGKFAPGRDMGVMLGGTTESKKFGYGVGAFNGGGESRQQDDQSLMYAARVWFDPLGEYKLSESANENVEKPVFHAGLGIRTGEAMKGTATSGVVEDTNNETAWNLELAWRNARLFAAGEYFAMTDEQANPTSGADVDSNGWYAQVGWMVRPKTVELALRRAEIDPDTDNDNDRVTESRLGFAYYWKGHNLKLQADIGQIDYEAGSRAYFPTATTTTIQGRGLPNPGTRLSPATEDLSDMQVRVQLQLAF